VVFKKYLTYTELGMIMMCTLPFSFKLFWSPFIEIYYFKKFGKRKSWVVPTQIVMFMMLFYMKDHLEQMLIDKQFEAITVILTTIVFVITCQDIAVDAWAVEMLHPQISDMGSTCQTVGQRIGFFLSGSIFITMSNAEFCKSWFDADEPLWTATSFL
jgi:MFS transporter, PAT family, solute carrier family 33 (acetyl-CoA transportor), member 1